MSYILDALKKSERQRNLRRVPTLDTLHDERPRPRKGRWIWLAAAAVLINAVVLAALFRLPPFYNVTGEVRTASPPPQVAARPAAPAGNDTLAGTPAPHAGAAPVPATGDAPPPSLAMVPQTPPPSSPPPASGGPARPGPKPQSKRPAVPALPPGINARPPRPPAQAPAPSRAIPRPAPAVVGAPAASPAPEPVAPEASEASGAEQQAASEPETPLLQRMPFEFQRSVPNVRIDALVYSDEPAGRMVFIANHKYKEGQQVEGGTLKVERITREGAVLSYQGQKFLLRP